MLINQTQASLITLEPGMERSVRMPGLWVRLGAAALTCRAAHGEGSHIQTKNSGETPISRARVGFSKVAERRKKIAAYHHPLITVPLRR
jgi:hypothetical protein